MSVKNLSKINWKKDKLFFATFYVPLGMSKFKLKRYIKKVYKQSYTEIDNVYLGDVYRWVNNRLFPSSLKEILKEMSESRAPRFSLLVSEKGLKIGKKRLWERSSESVSISDLQRDINGRRLKPFMEEANDRLLSAVKKKGCSDCKAHDFDDEGQCNECGTWAYRSDKVEDIAEALLHGKKVNIRV